MTDQGFVDNLDGLRFIVAQGAVGDDQPFIGQAGDQAPVGFDFGAGGDPPSVTGPR
jgi:hypothetical protein